MKLAFGAVLALVLATSRALATVFNIAFSFAIRIWHYHYGRRHRCIVCIEYNQLGY